MIICWTPESDTAEAWSFTGLLSPIPPKHGHSLGQLLLLLLLTP
ncbi:hypothetical protein MKX34_11145 [Paenibacillus sp. FSL R5-0636]|nr:hypothetical protein [Paenibacillus odorifer]MEC0130852.1 hypothetical protein [Paenibacillus odorifer]